MNILKIFYGLVILLTTTILLQSCSIFEDRTDILLIKIQDLEYSGQFAEAEKVYDQVCSLNKEASPMQLSILLSEARFFLRTKNYSKSILICQKGLKVCRSIFGPDDMLNTSFLFVLASAYDNLKEYDKAIASYKRIMAFASHSPCSSDLVKLLPIVKLGDIAFKRNKLHEALRLYQAASVLTGTTEIMARLINYRLAICLLALGNKSMAETHFEKSLPYRSFHAAPKDMYFKYAKLLEKDGKFGSSALARQRSEEWTTKHAEYVNWYYARTNPGSRCRLVDKCIEQDYDLVDAIAQDSTNK